jgi:hypothetical protein
MHCCIHPSFVQAGMHLPAGHLLASCPRHVSRRSRPKAETWGWEFTYYVRTYVRTYVCMFSDSTIINNASNLMKIPTISDGRWNFHQFMRALSVNSLTDPWTPGWWVDHWKLFFVQAVCETNPLGSSWLQIWEFEIGSHPEQWCDLHAFVQLFAKFNMLAHRVAQLHNYTQSYTVAQSRPVSHNSAKTKPSRTESCTLSPSSRFGKL